MKEIRPFGDVPQKLGVQIKRSFVATRAFSQALTVAADVLKNMQSVREMFIFSLCYNKICYNKINSVDKLVVSITKIKFDMQAIS